MSKVVHLHLKSASQLIRGVGPDSTGSGVRPGLRPNGHGNERSTRPARVFHPRLQISRTIPVVGARPSPSAGVTTHHSSGVSACRHVIGPILRASSWTEGTKRHPLRSQGELMMRSSARLTGRRPGTSLSTTASVEHDRDKRNGTHILVNDTASGGPAQQADAADEAHGGW